MFCARRYKTLMGLLLSLAAILLAHERFPPRSMNSKSPVVLQCSPPLQKNENYPHSPNLQRPCPQHSSALVLCHVRRRTPLLLRYLLIPQPLHRILLPASRCLLAAWLCSVSHGDNRVAIRFTFAVAGFNV